VVPRSNPTADTAVSKPIRDTPELPVILSVRRKHRHALRVDIGVGLLLAVAALLVVASGLAVVALVAIPVLAICLVSFAIGWLRSRRR
jgi:hypothetical protein